MYKYSLFFLVCSFLLSCGPGTGLTADSSVIAVAVDPAHFISESLLEPVTTEDARLSDGSSVPCYKIVTKSVAHEHPMGPWCPRHIDDGKDAGGIWFEGGKVYDVDGHFVASIAEFYQDETWQLYNEDGSIKVTETQEACEGAAKPRVEEIYRNHCVECQPAYYADHITTYYLPVTPRYIGTGRRFGRGAIGVAFNGVNFDPPAPTEMILRAHTLAPLDDCGGHVNPHAGYHYHAVTGCTKEIAQPDGHAPMIGYAMDGFAIYALEDTRDNQPADLDDCRGHEDERRGYHYHAGAAGSNQVLGCLSGAYGSTAVTH